MMMMMGIVVLMANTLQRSNTGALSGRIFDINFSLLDSACEASHV